MELQTFETDYLQDKDISYFEEVDQQRKSSPNYIYMADTLLEIQQTLEELNLPEAKVYNAETGSFQPVRNPMLVIYLIKGECNPNQAKSNRSNLDILF